MASAWRVPVPDSQPIPKTPSGWPQQPTPAGFCSSCIAEWEKHHFFVLYCVLSYRSCYASLSLKKAVSEDQFRITISSTKGSIVSRCAQSMAKVWRKCAGKQEEGLARQQAQVSFYTS